jgi:hypothetical protein
MLLHSSGQAWYAWRTTCIPADMARRRTAVPPELARAVVPGLLLALVILLFQWYLTLYLPSDGYKLADGELAGGDFAAFYQAGRMVWSDPGRLYDFEFFMARQQEFHLLHGVQGGKLLFAYPPLVAFLFSGLSKLSYMQAHVAWGAVSLCLFFVSVVMIFRSISAGRKQVFAACFAGLAFYVFSIFCLAAGQTSAIGTLIFSTVFVLLSQRRDLAAGLVLAFAYYKPPLFAGLVLVFLFACSWRILGGFILGGGLLLAATLLGVGGHTFAYYVSQASRYRYGQMVVAGGNLPLDKGVGLLAAAEGLRVLSGTPAQLVLAVLTIAGAFYLGRLWRGARDQAGPDRRTATEELLITYTLLVSFSLLMSFQMLIYDLSILYPLGAGSLYVLLRRKCTGKALVVLILATVGLYLEYPIRNIPVASVVFKGTTILWVIWTVSLALIRRQMRHDPEIPV